MDRASLLRKGLRSVQRAVTKELLAALFQTNLYTALVRRGYLSAISRLFAAVCGSPAVCQHIWDG